MSTRRSDRRLGVALIALSGGIAAAAILGPLVLDVGNVEAVAVAVGLFRHRPWARKAMYGIVGAYALLASSTTGMATVMWSTGDPDASGVTLLGAAVLTLALAGFVMRLYAPLFRPSTAPAALNAGLPSTRR